MMNVHKPFLSFKGDFLCDESTSAFCNNCHLSRTSLLADLALSSLSFNDSCSTELNVQSEFEQTGMLWGYVLLKTS